MVGLFARRYRISMDDFAGDIEDYPTLAAFFARPLDPARRPLKEDPGYFLAPADSVLTTCETVREDRATQVKGRHYRLSALVGEPFAFPEGWRVAVFYLSPNDYHRFHLPAAATITAARRDGGRLYPVNPFSTHRVPDLFVRNERVTLKCRTAGRDWYYVAVGAAFVGSIETAAGGIPSAHAWYAVGKDLAQTAEVGRFNMGSTIVIVLPEALAGEPLVAEGTKVRAGDRLWKDKGA